MRVEIGEGKRWRRRDLVGWRPSDEIQSCSLHILEHLLTVHSITHSSKPPHPKIALSSKCLVRCRRSSWGSLHPAATANLGGRRGGGVHGPAGMRSRPRTGHRGKEQTPGEAAIQGDASAAELTPADSSPSLCPTPHEQHLISNYGVV